MVVFTKADTTPVLVARDTLVPVVSALAGALLTLAWHETCPLMAGITGAITGAAAGTLLMKRSRSSVAEPTYMDGLDNREIRISALETELACQITLHEAFKLDAATRQAELE